MRKIFDVFTGRSNVPQDIPEDFDLTKIKIDNLWSIYDPSVLLDGEGNLIPIDQLVPQHHKGYFVESGLHDYDIRKGKLYYFSRVGDIGDPIKILIEYEVIDDEL